MMKNRLIVGLLAGAILGVVCIVGASVRNPDVTTTFLFAFWFNRVVMGLAIGLTAPSSKQALLVKGTVLGTFVSFAFYSSTDFQDLMGFFAGVVYGVLIALAIYYFVDRHEVLEPKR